MSLGNVGFKLDIVSEVANMSMCNKRKEGSLRPRKYLELEHRCEKVHNKFQTEMGGQ